MPIDRPNREKNEVVLDFYFTWNSEKRRIRRALLRSCRPCALSYQLDLFPAEFRPFLCNIAPLARGFPPITAVSDCVDAPRAVLSDRIFACRHKRRMSEERAGEALFCLKF